MGGYGSQSGDRIAAANAYDAEFRMRLQNGPQLLVTLPEELVRRWADVTVPEMLTLDHKHSLVIACRKALGLDR